MTPTPSDKAAQIAIPLILRFLAEWEDKHGSLCAITPDEWMALMEPITRLAVMESPRMARTHLNESVIHEPGEPVADLGCICRGNWRLLVSEVEHLFGKRFENRGREFTFFGLVHSEDDYYYGMYDGKHGLHLLSCVGSIEGHGYKHITASPIPPAPSQPPEPGGCGMSATMAGPTEEGFTDAVQAIEAASLRTDCSRFGADLPKDCPIPDLLERATKVQSWYDRSNDDRCGEEERFER